MITYTNIEANATNNLATIWYDIPWSKLFHFSMVTVF